MAPKTCEVCGGVKGECGGHPLSEFYAKLKRCPICESPVEKIDEHGALINHGSGCSLTSTHPDSDEQQWRKAGL